MEDEDDFESKDKKKKKKKQKKKKKKPTTEEAAAVETLNVGQLSLNNTHAPATPATPASPAPAPSTTTTTNGTPATPTSPTQSKPKSAAKTAPVKQPVFNASTTTLPGMSTTSLPLGRTETAQSAHKYLKAEGLLAGKEKVKSRADHANLTPIPEKKKKGYWSRFSRKDRTEEDEPEQKGNKFSFFSNLSKKTSTYMHQLLNTSEDEKKGLAPMKWEHFLKVWVAMELRKWVYSEVSQVMREMGFTYDPSTAGSSVRFDPPDPRDVVSVRPYLHRLDETDARGGVIVDHFPQT